MLSLFAILSAASAANNAFTNPVTHITVNAGDSLDITWTNASGPAADILLRTGESNDLQTVATIASQITNQGSFSWSVPSDTKTGIYALQLSADGGENYSSMFTIIGDSSEVFNSTNSTKPSKTTDSFKPVDNSTAISSVNSFVSSNSTSDATKSTAISTDGFNPTGLSSSTDGSQPTFAAAASAGGSNSSSVGGPAGATIGSSTRSRASKTTSGSVNGSDGSNSGSGRATSSGSSGTASSNGVILTLSRAVAISAIGVGAALFL